MPNHLSTLGIIHTVISIIALLVAFFALLRDGRINPANLPGKLYIILTIATCFTGFPIMRTGHLTAGHFLSIIILILLVIAIFAKSISAFGKSAEYIQTFIMSTTLFFSLIPAITETLTRFPKNKPFASGPYAPVILLSLMILFILYFAGMLYQLLKLRARRKANKIHS